MIVRFQLIKLLAFLTKRPLTAANIATLPFNYKLAAATLTHCVKCSVKKKRFKFHDKHVKFSSRDLTSLRSKSNSSFAFLPVCHANIQSFILFVEDSREYPIEFELYRILETRAERKINIWIYSIEITQI
jgi:hypothetical protein